VAHSVVSAMPRPSGVSPGLRASHVIRQLAGPHSKRIGAAEGDHRHLAEKTMIR
jgi:hypothetical protein